MGKDISKTTLLSMQNQDFKDIEIIFVVDCSKDNSVNLIKELMIKDPRIKLYKNKQNKGMLYTKTRGILHAKGKYVMLLDVDDIYAQRDAFSTLLNIKIVFKEICNKNNINLDILGFVMLAYRIDLRKWLNIKKYIKTDVIYKSKVYSIMYKCNSLYCRRRGCATACYFFRTNIFIDVINQIDDKYINVKMNFIDDCLLFFLLTRKAHNLRQIKRIFYLIVRRSSENNYAKIQFRLNEKKK